MAFREKRAWIMVVVSAVGYAVYLSIVLSRAGDRPLGEAPYVGALLWSVGGAIVAAIVLEILVSIASPRTVDRGDVRDREIHRFGEYVGQSFLIVGGVAALLLAMAEVGYFWIANAVYLCFVLSSLLGSTAKIVAYRRGF